MNPVCKDYHVPVVYLVFSASRNHTVMLCACYNIPKAFFFWSPISGWILVFPESIFEHFPNPFLRRHRKLFLPFDCMGIHKWSNVRKNSCIRFPKWSNVRKSLHRLRMVDSSSGEISGGLSMSWVLRKQKIESIFDPPRNCQIPCPFALFFQPATPSVRKKTFSNHSLPGGSGRFKNQKERIDRKCEPRSDQLRENQQSLRHLSYFG